jgi:hypothetical protein
MSEFWKLYHDQEKFDLLKGTVSCLLRLRLIQGSDITVEAHESLLRKEESLRVTLAETRKPLLINIDSAFVQPRTGIIVIGISKQ